jgi:hypothetical protein
MVFRSAPLQFHFLKLKKQNTMAVVIQAGVSSLKVRTEN